VTVAVTVAVTVTVTVTTLELVVQFEAASARDKDFALAHQREFEKELANQGVAEHHHQRQSTGYWLLISRAYCRASQVRWRYLECLPAMTRLEFIGADMTHHSNTVDKANQ
jgi:hypothetical protein